MLGAAVLVVVRADRRAAHARDHPVDTLTAQQAITGAVDAVLDIVEAAGLQSPAGAYSFRSCNTAGGPPYRVVVNLNFTVPQGNPPGYLKSVASTMNELGWSDAATPAPHFGHKLTAAGLTSTFFRTRERTDLATMTVDGECRVVDVERPTAWVDVTARLRAAN